MGKARRCYIGVADYPVRESPRAVQSPRGSAWWWGAEGANLPGTSQAPGLQRAGNLKPPSGDRRGGNDRSAHACRPREEPQVTIDSTPAVQPDFISRHIGPDHDDVAAMLKVVGQPSLDAMLDTAMPGVIRNERALRLDAAPTEEAVIAELRALASRNTVLIQMIGLGYYGTVTPAVIKRNVFESPAWYTAYTPYQPEISQGRLEALLNFQTVIVDLTGLKTASASLLDEATAAAEAMAMARRVTKSQANAFFVDCDCHPQTIAVVRTRAEPLGWNVIVGNPVDLDPATVFGALFQYPGSSGGIADPPEWIK